MNAAGGYITPGFLDIHRHGDWQAFGNGDDELLNRQGLTTVVNGNCGLSVAPAGEKFGKEIARFLSSVTGDFRWGKDENTDDTEGVLFSKKKEESCGISEKEKSRRYFWSRKIQEAVLSSGRKKGLPILMWSC